MNNYVLIDPWRICLILTTFFRVSIPPYKRLLGRYLEGCCQQWLGEVRAGRAIRTQQGTFQTLIMIESEIGGRSRKVWLFRLAVADCSHPPVCPCSSFYQGEGAEWTAAGARSASPYTDKRLELF